jgi:hypothetical protein
MSTISIESITAFLEKLKIPKSLDEFLDSSKNDQVVVGGLAGLIKYAIFFLQIWIVKAIAAQQRNLSM